jgi:hypothetical protein
MPVLAKLEKQSPVADAVRIERRESRNHLETGWNLKQSALL